MPTGSAQKRLKSGFSPGGVICSRKGHSTSVANCAAKRYSPRVPYLFPYEDLFVYTISLLIVGLLYMRVRYARKRRRDSARSNL